jgi:hypothetical protein
MVRNGADIWKTAAVRLNKEATYAACSSGAQTNSG